MTLDSQTRSLFAGGDDKIFQLIAGQGGRGKKRCVVMAKTLWHHCHWPHPGIAARQPPIGRMANADEAEPFGFRARSAPTTDLNPGVERRWMIRKRISFSLSDHPAPLTPGGDSGRRGG